MIELLGYITAYLLVGVVMLPFGFVVRKIYPQIGFIMVLEILFWPGIFILNIVLIYVHGLVHK